MSADVYAEDGYYAVVPEWVLDADISAQAVRLYAVLRRYADQRSMLAHPSRRTLATRMHLADLKAVDRALADLKSIGAVETFERFSEDGDRSSNGYRIKARGKDSSQGGGPNDMGGGGSKDIGVGAQKGEEPQPENHSQLNHTPRAPRGRRDGEPETFAEFWAAYPTKRGGRKGALDKYRTALKTADHDTIMAGLRATKFSPEERLQPHAQTWLHQERWTVAQPTQAPPAPDGTVRPMYDVSKVPAHGALWSDEQVDMVLGPDTTPMDPPAGLDEDQAYVWTHRETQRRKTLRRRQAQELTGWRFEA